MLHDQKWTQVAQKWPQVAQKWRHLTWSGLKLAAEGQKLTFWMHFDSYRAVTRGGGSYMIGNAVTWLEVTQKWRHLTGRDLEVTVEGWKLATSVHFISCTAVTRGRYQLRGRKWPHDRKWLEMTRKWCHLTRSDLQVVVEGQKLTFRMHFNSYRA